MIFLYCVFHIVSIFEKVPKFIYFLTRKMSNTTDKRSSSEISSETPIETLSEVNEENQRPKRARCEISRYGERESDVNDDSLFDAADKEAVTPSPSVSDLTTTSSSSSVSDSVDLSGLSPGELLIYKKMCSFEQILNRIDSRMTNIEVQISILKNGKQTLQKPDPEMMLKCGLPLADKSNLDDFEFHLLTLEFETQVVSATC